MDPNENPTPSTHAVIPSNQEPSTTRTRPPRTGEFLCDQCGQKLSRRDALIRHARIVHNQGELYICQDTQCVHSKRSFKRRHDYIQHMRNVHNIIVPARPKYVRGNQDRTVTQYRELKPKLQHEARRDSQGQTSRELPPAPGQIEPERRIPRSQVPTTLAQPAMSRPAPVRPQVSQLFLPQPALSRSTTPQQVPPYQIPPPLQPLPPHVPDFYYTHGPAFRPEVLQHPVNAVPRVIPGFPPVNAQPQNPGIRLSIEQVRRLRAAPTAQDQQEFLLEVVRAQARHSGDNQFAELMAAMIRPHRFRQRGQSCAGRHGLTGAPTTSGVQPQPTGHGGPVQGGQFASYPPPNHHLSGL